MYFMKNQYYLKKIYMTGIFSILGLEFLGSFYIFVLVENHMKSPVIF